MNKAQKTSLLICLAVFLLAGFLGLIGIHDGNADIIHFSIWAIGGAAICAWCFHRVLHS